MNGILKRPSGQRGFTMIELMVAILLGLFLIAGTISIFISNKQSYTAQNDLGRIQETGRFAMDMIVRDVRMAGFFGCVNSMAQNELNNVLNAAGTAGSLLNTQYAIEGLDHTDTTPQWHPSSAAVTIDDASISYGGTNIGDIVSNTDGITVRHASGLTWQLNANMNSPSDAVPTNANPSSLSPSPTGGSSTISNDVLSKNQVVVVSNCSSGYVFNISGAPTPSLSHATGTAFYQNKSSDLAGYQLDTTPQVMPLVAIRYYICNDAATPPATGVQPALCQASYDPNTQSLVTQPVLDGVESMQITYGIDTSGDGQVDQYVRAGAVTDWASILSVKIGLLVRSIKETSTNPVDNNSYTVNGYTFTAPGDRRKRRVFENVVFLRNAGAFSNN